MSELVARGMPEPVARGIGQLNQAAIQVADSRTLKSLPRRPNNAPAMVPLKETSVLFKALAEKSAVNFERAAVEICALPMVPVYPAPPPELTCADFTDKVRLPS